MTGIALIKPEYLRQSSQTDNDRKFNIAEPSVQIDGKSSDVPVDEEEAKNDGTALEDDSICGKRKPQDKKERRGQNKKRPRPQRPKDRDRLCQSVNSNGKCQFGDKCRFEHDLKKFWELKPADIADRCPNYDAFGKCAFGFSCRFAGAHVDTTLWKNTENQEKISTLATCGKKNERNAIEKDLQKILRQHRYDYKRSVDVMAELESGKSAKVDMGPGDQGDVKVCDVDVVGKERRLPTRFDWTGRLYLAPLTTVGNLPFRRICTRFGADITCGEMAMAYELLDGKSSEWALVKRHHSERTFGVQLCGNNADVMTKCAQLLTDQLDVDFIDVNMGCPIDLVCTRGAGCSLMTKQRRLEQILLGMRRVMPDNIALTVKMRTGYYESKSTAHLVAPKLSDLGVSLFTLHGRSREQRYSKLANWGYVCECAKAADPLPCFGCGDVLSYEDYDQHLDELLKSTSTGTGGIMIARGALIKPWIFTEIKERRHWDISASERLDILKEYVNFGLQHWGSDQQGVNNTRRFLLEWLSFLHRYIPVGILEQLPQRINERPPRFVGRNDLETLMASGNCSDWVKISEMLLGPVPEEFSFLPKHKANSY